MAHFYGTVRGARGEASRLGHKTTGFRADAASWQGRVSVTLHYDEASGQDIATVRLEPHNGAGVDRVLWRGLVSGEEAE